MSEDYFWHKMDTPMTTDAMTMMAAELTEDQHKALKDWIFKTKGKKGLQISRKTIRK